MTNKLFYFQFSSASQEELDHAFFKACEKNELDKIEYLLTSPELKLHANIHTNGEYKIPDGGLLVACREQYLDIVRFLLASPKLKEHIIFADSTLAIACRTGNVEIVDYMLTSPDIQIRPDFTGDKVFALYQACLNDRLPLVKYLLESPKLKEHSDIYAGNASSFRVALESNHVDILQYLVFDYRIEKTNEIEKHLENDWAKEVKNWFAIRELNGKLSEELSNNEITKKKSKI